MSDSLDSLFIEFSSRKLRQLSAHIETCLGRLSDDQTWTRGGSNENAIGNLILHLCGNVRQWIVTGVGGRPDVRDRDAEFAARGGPGSRELAEWVHAAVEEAAGVLASVQPGRLTQRVAIQQYEVTVMEAIYHVVEHFSMHAGQIVFATKAITGGDLEFYRHLRSQTAHGQTTP